MAARLGLHGTDYVVGWTAWLDLVARRCLQGLRAGVRRPPPRPVREDTLAIGDGRNDIEMLRWAARGVAMGQAVEEVHEAADATTDTVYDDGAALELRRWFRGRGALLAGGSAGDLPSATSRCACAVTPEDAEGMLAGRRRVSWHPDYPRKDDQDAAAMVKAR